MKDKQKKKTREVTIMDVAEKSGVSIATVSRVLNRTGRYSGETLRKVEAVAREIGYTPNHIAKSLKLKRTKQIALAVADIGNPVYVAMAKAVQRVAKNYGYRLVLLSTEALAAEEFGIIKSLSKQYVDGLIISPLLYCEKHKELIKQAIRPVVVITGTGSDPEIDSVLVDSSEGVRLAMEHLLAQGYSKIAFLNGPSETVPGVSRLNGYYASLIEHGLPRDPNLVFSSDFTLAGGYLKAQKIIEEIQGLDAIMCANDLMALGVIRYLLARGLKVPHDIAVVGMDDIEHGANYFPALTTVSLLAAERGRMAAELLFERLTSDITRKPQQLQVVPRLVVRESSVCVRT
ncbi:MAG TPA: LacI family transcriptional regulator [Firmicutes bacterium]|nr:LacI family transcriptional regulator [Bacillota bacterium]